jgi:hypothetical protein
MNLLRGNFLLPFVSGQYQCSKRDLGTPKHFKKSITVKALHLI